MPSTKKLVQWNELQYVVAVGVIAEVLCHPTPLANGAVSMTSVEARVQDTACNCEGISCPGPGLTANLTVKSGSGYRTGSRSYSRHNAGQGTVYHSRLWSVPRTEDVDREIIIRL